MDENFIISKKGNEFYPVILACCIFNRYCVKNFWVRVNKTNLTNRQSKTCRKQLYLDAAL